MQGDCDGRIRSIDPVFAQGKGKGGYRQFADMTQFNPNAQDRLFGSLPTVSFKDDFVVSAGANATIYFALRYCSAGGIPYPMRFEVSITPQTLFKETSVAPFGAVCLASGLKEATPNSNVKSVTCESDVGEYDQCVHLRLEPVDHYLAGQSCLLKGYRTLREIEDTSAFKGNKVCSHPSGYYQMKWVCAFQSLFQVVALLAVLFAFVATCVYGFFLWKYNGK